MTHKGTFREPALAALLICPDKDLAAQVAQAFAEVKAFELVSELRSYPQPQTMEIRLRQAQPEVVLLDLSSDFEQAKQVLRFVVSYRPPVQVVGLHRSSDPTLLLDVLQAGATDFLHAPFDEEAQRGASARIRRLRSPEEPEKQEYGQVVAFASTKPGSGASTLATQVAFGLRGITNKRVLLADFDIMAGALAFTLKLNPTYSVLDAIEHSDHLDPAFWSSLTVTSNGVDVLAAPDIPTVENLESSRIHEILEYARILYDYVLIDLPTVFHQLSLFMLSEADQAFLISTSELVSLHLGRRAVGLLSQLGFERDRYQMVVNRVAKKENIALADMEKIFTCPVLATLPNDYYALHKVVTRGEPLNSDNELGKAVERLCARIAGVSQKEKKGSGSVLGARPVLSEG
jgi:pilus assembly protein CpaE